tara:strand:+ start:1806 stop:2081 length:276 start_codon:yes stop_codon:yes gene_type:complete
MAGSNITAVRRTTTGAISAGPVRLYGCVALPAANAGTVVFDDGGTNLLTMDTAAGVDSGQIWISFPQEGIRFSTNCNATMTNVTAITAFWG